MMGLQRRTYNMYTYPWLLATVTNLPRSMPDSTRRKYAETISVIAVDQFKCDPEDVAVTFGPDAPAFMPERGPVTVEILLIPGSSGSREHELVHYARLICESLQGFCKERMTLVLLCDESTGREAHTDNGATIRLRKAEREFLESRKKKDERVNAVTPPKAPGGNDKSN